MPKVFSSSDTNNARSPQIVTLVSDLTIISDVNDNHWFEQ